MVGCHNTAHSTANTTAHNTAEDRFPIMGTQGHVLVHGDHAPALLVQLRERLQWLEACWSRFLPTSEISRANAARGEPIVVSPETVGLVERAHRAWELTNGRFDPMLLVQLERLGYDRTFADLGHGGSGALPHPSLAMSSGCVGVTTDRVAGTITIPRHVSFDPGGIGKGYAADLVARAAMEAGAAGVLVNLGGDLRVEGRPPQDRLWTIRVHERALQARPLTVLRLAAGAVATSTTLKRRWRTAHGEQHHVLNPFTGLPRTGGAVLVTVVAGEAWWAEAAATAMIGSGCQRLPDTAAIRVLTTGEQQRSGPIDAYEPTPATPRGEEPCSV